MIGMQINKGIAINAKKNSMNARTINAKNAGKMEEMQEKMHETQEGIQKMQVGI